MLIAAVLGYLFGSIPVAVLVAKRHAFDPRDIGDGNPGWWNMRHAIGDARASLVFALDIVKGAVPVFIAAHLWGPWWWAYIAGIFAVIGHSFPVFAGFRGGRSVLTFMGAAVVLAPSAVLVTVVSGAIAAAITRNMALGLRVMVFAVPVVQLFIDPATHVALTGVMMTLVGLRFLAARTVVRARYEPDVSSPA